MPAARAALPPEYRIFYDALQDYGDWVLIEPYGYLFRPRATFPDWRPYESGFWAPTDAYGWVWISNEPFGWATYHYGRWAYDEYQGWVWRPGTDWAPAWVDWRASDQYVGWSPLGPGGGTPRVPGGSYIFTSIGSLGSTDLSGQIKTQSQLGAEAASAKPVTQSVLLEGVRVPAGPPVELVEKVRGERLPRATLDEMLSKKPLVEAASGDESTPAPTLEELRRAGEQASREAKTISSKGGQTPEHLPLLRPSVRRGLAKPGIRPALKDTTSRRRGG
jgi:hypothetical protein